MFSVSGKNGHIHSVEYKGKELLFQSAKSPDDGDYPGTGWDEMLATVEECEMDLPGYGRVRLPDHGEAWHKDWDGKRFEGRVLPYVFRVDYRTQGKELVLDYSFENVGPHPIPCFWAMHPVMVGEAERPGEAVRLTQDHPRFGKAGTLATIGPLLPGETLKYYYDRPMNEARFTAQGIKFKLLVEESDVPMYLGVWENAGGWKGEVNFAPELSTAGDDSARRAFEMHRLAFVEPGKILRWRIRWHAI